MRHVAVALATALVVAMAAPAFAQPFADTSTNHWAYDALAELAAKGLIEGYPDGTFKGDRAMTRYEMAMVVARLLARIESIQIPTPPPPEVTRADIDMILRLVNEFRAELAAKNVRLTAVEEELNAIKARLSNVRITGGLRFREDLNQFQGGNPSGGGNAFTNSLNGNPKTSQFSASTTQRGNRPRYEFKLGFDGSVAPDLHFIVGLESAGDYNFWNSGAYGFGFQSCPLGVCPGVNTGNNSNGAFGAIDSAFLDWKPTWAGGTTEVWFGRFGTDTPCGGGCYPLQFGPFGLLLNDSGDEWEDAIGNQLGVNVADGIRLAFNFPSLANLRFQALWIRVEGNIGSLSFPSGEDAYGGDLNFTVIPGLVIGGYYVANSVANSGSSAFPGSSPFGNLFHLYGPGGGGLNPATARCVPSGPGTGAVAAAALPTNPAAAANAVAAASGINCPIQGNGYGAYVQWDIIPGIHLDLEGAQWSDTSGLIINGTAGGTDYGAIGSVTFNLSQLAGVPWNTSLVAGYEYMGVNFYAPYGGAELDLIGDYWDVLYPGNGQGFFANVSISPLPQITIYGNGLWGNSVSNSQNFTEYVVGIRYNFSANAAITLKYRDLAMGGVEQMNVYRAQIDYSF
jgi:S-layer homology domain